MSQDQDVRIMDRQRRLDRAERRRARADGVNPRKAAACMKARAALQAKRDAKKHAEAFGFPGGAADGGRLPQSGGRTEGPLPPLSPRPDFLPGVSESEGADESAGAISENSEVSSGKAGIRKSGQVEKSVAKPGQIVVDETAGAPPEFALHDRPGAVFKPPREPVVTRDKDGRMVVK